jgi:enoyl-[acyl-carrier protein] reductase II
MMAAMALGADGVQIGSRFVASKESSAHAAFKNAVLLAKEGDTQLTLKELTPVRLLKNKFYQDLQSLYATTPTADDLKTFLGRGRAKRGMFEGDLEKGELEIGQISGLIDEVSSVSDIVDSIISEFKACKTRISTFNLNNQHDE